VRERGAEVIRGPMNPSTNYECALLVEGFELDPMVMMPYNPPYYAEMLEGYGMNKAMDLYAYDIGVEYFNHSNKLQRVAERLRKKSNISVRPVNMKDFRNEVGIIRQVLQRRVEPQLGICSDERRRVRSSCEGPQTDR
jgi:hypothetical protein